jgi:N-acetylglutamate synthase-like GNAT family acetyltransferase
MNDTSLEGAFRRICSTEAPLKVRLADFSSANAIEIVSLAVVPERRGEGIATRLIEEAEMVCRLCGVRRLVVCTGSWETDNIVFYVKRGFRIFNVVRDFFTLERGYDLAIRDQVQFEKGVTAAMSQK